MSNEPLVGLTSVLVIARPECVMVTPAELELVAPPPLTLAIFTAEGEEPVAVKFTVILVLWPIPSGPTFVHVRFPAITRSGVTLAETKERFVDGYVSVTATTGRLVLPVLMICRLKETAVPEPACPFAGDISVLVKLMDAMPGGGKMVAVAVL